MSILASPLALHDVEDVEGLCRRALDDRLHFWGARLRQTMYDDFISELIVEAWQLSRRYDPKKGPSFTTHAYRILRLRVADCYRRHMGDTRNGVQPIVLSLNAPLSLAHGQGDDLGEHFDSGGGGDRMDEALASSAGDPAECLSTDLLRVLEGRSGGEPEPVETVGEPPLQRARPGAGAPRRVAPRVPPKFKDTDTAGSCDRCLPIFRSAFARANNQRAEADRVSPEKLEKQAKARSKRVRFNGHWLCPRCTTVALGDQTVLFDRVYPNRAARRGQTARPHPTRNPRSR